MYKILAIDDQSDNLVTLKAIDKTHLKNCGLLTATSGREGIDLAISEKPDVILLDVIMPGLDGFEVCSILKANPETRHIPVIILTAIKTDAESRVKGLNLGADAFLPKPIDAIELAAQVNVMLRIKNAEDELREEKRLLEQKVSERTRELSETAGKFKSIFDEAVDGIILLNKDLTIINVNQAFIEITGIPKNEIVGISGLSMARSYISRDQRPNFLILLKDLLLKKSVKQIELKLRGKVLEISPKHQANGQIVGIIRDITDRKKAEDALRNIASKFSSVSGLEFLVKVCEHVGQTLDMDYVFVGKLKPGKKNVEVVTGYRKNGILTPFEYNLENTPCEKVIGQSICSYAKGVQELFPHDHLLVQMGVESYLGVPLFDSSRQPLGIMVVLNNKPLENKEIAESVVQIFSDRVAAEMERSISEMALLESERKINTLFNNLQGIAYRCKNDKDWTMEYVSAGFEKITGYKCEDVIGNKNIIYNDLIYPEDRERVWLEVQNALNNKETYDIRFRLQTMDGHIVHVMERGTGIFSEKGEVLALEGYITDITRQVEAEQALRWSEELNRSVTETAADAIVTIDSHGRVLTWNLAAEEMFGFLSGEIIGKGITDIVPAHAIEKHKAGLKRLETVSEHKLIGKTVELTAVRKDLEEFPIELSLSVWEMNNRKFYTGIIRDITVRKQNEASLNRLYTAVEQSGSLIVITDAAGKIEYANPANLEITGYSMEELKGQNPRIFKSGKQPAEVYTDLWKTILKGEEWWGEFQNRKKNGELFWESSSISPIHNDEGEIVNFIKVGEDITDKVHAEKQIKLLSKAIEQSPSSVVITDANGEIEFVNARFSDFMQYQPEEVIGKTPRIFNPGHVSEQEFQNMWKTLREGGIWEMEYLNRKKDKTIFWDKVMISPMHNSMGQITNYIIIGNDVSEAKELMQDLVEAKEKAEENNRLKTAFLQNISHEIRTPMNGILGFSSLLKEPQLSGETQQEFIDIIMKSGERMLNTVNDLMDISMIEAGQVKITIANIYLFEIVQNLYLFFKPDAEAKGLELKLVVDDSVREIHIDTDREKITAILTNLIKNAIKYTFSGTIEIGFKKEAGILKLYVKDTGIGVAYDKQQAIFDRFIQAEYGESRLFEGSGLGLSICKAYTEMLHGEIGVKSALGAGSLFFVNLPLNESAEIEPEETVEHANEPVEFSNMKILVAEDEEVVAIFLGKVLEKISKQVEFCQNGVEAVEICRNNPNIDMVLMDIRMPVMNGYDATRKIREFNTDVVIIAQTAFALEGDREKAINAGCNEYITKPIKMEELLEMMYNLFKRN